MEFGFRNRRIILEFIILVKLSPLILKPCKIDLPLRRTMIDSLGAVQSIGRLGVQNSPITTDGVCLYRVLQTVYLV